MTRVLVVSKALTADVYRRKLVALSDLGIEIIAVAPPFWKEGGSIVHLEPASATGYRLISSPLRWNGHFHLHHYPELAAIVGEVRPDLLHMDEEPYNLATWLGVRAARRARIPTVFFSWQNLHRWYPPPFSWIERGVFDGCRVALAGSDSVKDVLRAKGFTGEVIVTPQFGVDPNLFHPRPRADDRFTVGMFNRLVPAKAPLECIEAFATLPSECRMLIVGDGPLRAEVAMAIDRHGLADRVTLHSRVPSWEMPRLMAAVDSVLLFSRTTRSWTEQFGRVLIEGMASGAVVVGSDAGEIPWVIGDAGVVVPEGDIEGLGQALLRVYADSVLRQELRAAGLERVRRQFTNERIARLTARAYSLSLDG